MASLARPKRVPIVSPLPNPTVSFSFPSQDVRKDSNLDLQPRNQNLPITPRRGRKPSKKSEPKISVNIRTVQERKDIAISFNNKTTQNEGQEVSLNSELVKKDEKIKEDWPKLNDDPETSSRQKLELQKVEDSKKKIRPADFKPFGAKKFISLEGALGIKPTSPRPKVDSNKKPSEPDWRASYSQTLARIAEYEKREREKRHVLMFLPTAFIEPHLNASDVQMLYGLFKASEVVPFYSKDCRPLGYGVMTVAMERQTDVQKWAPNHPWKAIKMMQLRSRKPEMKDKTVVLYINNNSKFPDAQLESLLTRCSSSIQWCFNSAGEPLHQLLVEMSYENASTLKEHVFSAHNNDANFNFHKMKILEIAMP